MKRKILHLVRTAADTGRVPDKVLRPDEQVRCIDACSPQELLEQIFAHDTAVLW